MIETKCEVPGCYNVRFTKVVIDEEDLLQCKKCGGLRIDLRKKEPATSSDSPDVSSSTELSGSTPIKLLESDGVGLSAFHYWYTCPECKYVWIRMQDNYCGGCGREIEVMVAHNEITINGEADE